MTGLARVAVEPFVYFAMRWVGSSRQKQSPRGVTLGALGLLDPDANTQYITRHHKKQAPASVDTGGFALEVQNSILILHRARNPPIPEEARASVRANHCADTP